MLLSMWKPWLKLEGEPEFKWNHPMFPMSCKGCEYPNRDLAVIREWEIRIKNTMTAAVTETTKFCFFALVESTGCCLELSLDPEGNIHITIFVSTMDNKHIPMWEFIWSNHNIFFKAVLDGELYTCIPVRISYWLSEVTFFTINSKHNIILC